MSCIGIIAIVTAIVLAVILVVFVGAGIYSAGYILWIGLYNFVVLIRLMTNHKKVQKPDYTSNKKGKHR